MLSLVAKRARKEKVLRDLDKLDTFTQSGVVNMPRDQVIQELNKVFICAENVRIKKVDYSGNPLAPESTAYKVYFNQFGERRKVTYWPNSVGFQG